MIAQLPGRRNAVLLMKSRLGGAREVTLEAEVRDQFLGCLLGLAVGDAVGTTVEFKPRGSFAEVTDMVGGGPFGLLPGQWTDDTAMALCLASSLVECGTFDAMDQMNRYCRWWRTGEYSSNGRCFDIGGTVRSALERFTQTGEPFSGPSEPWTAGNGCIMRLAPVVLFYFPDAEKVETWAAESARTTHGAAECLAASRLLARILLRALSGAGKEQVLAPDAKGFATTPKIEAVAQGAYRTKSQAEIRGSGYVVDCLEAALWCFDRTDSFRDAVLLAANLGDDADTTAAVCGQIAGAHYGAGGIPAAWLERLAKREVIIQLAEQLYAAANARFRPA